MGGRKKGEGRKRGKERKKVKEIGQGRGGRKVGRVLKGKRARASTRLNLDPTISITIR